MSPYRGSMLRNWSTVSLHRAEPFIVRNRVMLMGKSSRLRCDSSSQPTTSPSLHFRGSKESEASARSPAVSHTNRPVPAADVRLSLIRSRAIVTVKSVPKETEDACTRGVANVSCSPTVARIGNDCDANRFSVPF